MAIQITTPLTGAAPVYSFTCEFTDDGNNFSLFLRKNTTDNRIYATTTINGEVLSTGVVVKEAHNVFHTKQYGTLVLFNTGLPLTTDERLDMYQQFLNGRLQMWLFSAGDLKRDDSL